MKIRAGKGRSWISEGGRSSARRNARSLQLHDPKPFLVALRGAQCLAERDAIPHSLSRGWAARAAAARSDIKCTWISR